MNLQLTKREVEVIECASHGLTVVETARKLHMAPDTVRRHRSRVRIKMDGHGKGMAFIIAECFRHGYLRADPNPSPIALSPQARKILLRICSGMENAEIGAELYITLDSVKTHNRRMFKRMSAKSRSHAAAIALRTGTIRFTPRPESTGKE